MKTLKLIRYSFLALSLLFVSCQEETLNNDNPETNPTIEENTNTASNLETERLSYLLTHNSINVKYPLFVATIKTINPNSSIEEFNTKANFIEFATTLDTESEFSSINYPFTIIDEFQTELTITNNTQFLDRYNQINNQNQFLTDDLKQKTAQLINNQVLNFVLPITVWHQDNKNEESEKTNEIFSTISTFINFLNTPESQSNQPFTRIQFPISYRNNNQSLATINTLKELKDVVTLFDTENENEDVNSNNDTPQSVIDVVRYLTQYNGSFDDFIDNARNFSINFPYDIEINNQIITIENRRDLADFEKLITNNPQEFSVVNNDSLKTTGFHVTSGVRRLEVLKLVQDIFDTRSYLQGRTPFSCLKVNYPIFLNTRKNEQMQINSDAEFSFYSDSQINYPIELIDEQQNIITITNEDEFVNSINRCNVN